MPLKILHTADWQIGKAFARFPQEAAVSLQEHRIGSIKKIAAVACEHNVDAVLVAGDVFEYESMAERTLHQVVNATSAFAGLWLMLPGNHDPGIDEGVWAQLRSLDGLPSNIVVLDKPEPFTIPGKNAVVLPAPLQRKHEAVDVTAWFDTYMTDPAIIRIGLAHGSLDNRLPERGEAPNTISDRRAETAKLDYLALGDWHGTLNPAKKTWYSGTHETDRFRANDSGNVLVVEMDTHGAEPRVKKIPTGHYKWYQLAPAIAGDSPTDQIDEALKACGSATETLVIQIAPRGHASLDDRLKIEKLMTRWSALVRHIELVDDNLVSEATQDDFQQLGAEGFVHDAVSCLQALSADNNNPDREVADLALQLLYTEHKLIGSKK